ncbi:MAG: helical backbone metal receptor [Methanomassiliicoccus sp.]|nr:helical backbone metal receptor [Methanomassiliicoccus sp.]
MEKNKRNAIIAIILVVAIVASTIVIVSSPAASGKYSATVTDALGRNVTISNTPSKIVSCSPDITETVYAVGLGEKLVGVTDYCDYPSDVGSRKANGSLATIGGYSTPNVEAIAKLSPDVVLISGGVSAQKTMVTQLEQLNLTVVALYKGTSFSEVYKNIQLVGTIGNAQAKSDALVSNMQSHLQWVANKLSSVTTSRSIADVVYIDPIYVAGSDTYVQDMINASKGTNVFVSQSGWPVISSEGMIAAEPDVMVMSSSMLMSTGQDLLSYLRNDSIWSTISSVKTDNTYVLTGQASNLLNRPGPRLVDGVEIMADMLYPSAMGVTLPKVLDSNYTNYINSTASFSDDNIPKTVTDGLGRSVTLSGQPTRIISTSDVPTQILYALGMGSKIIGVSSDGRYNNSDNINGIGNLGNYPSDVKARLNSGELASVGGTWHQNAETIAALHPDLVVLDSASYSYSGIGDQLSALGITFFVLPDEVSLGQIYNNVQMMGDLLGKSATASNIVSSMGSSIDSTLDKIGGTSSDESCAFIFLSSITGGWAVANGTFMDSLITTAGMKDAFGNQSGWIAITLEALVQANPDVLIIDQSMGGLVQDFNSTWDQMRTDPLWSQIQAVKDGKVYFVTGLGAGVIEDASIRAVEAVTMFAMMGHPDAFLTKMPMIVGDDYQTYLT